MAPSETDLDLWKDQLQLMHLLARMNLYDKLPHSAVKSKSLFQSLRLGVHSNQKLSKVNVKNSLFNLGIETSQKVLNLLLGVYLGT